tara:strand:- start:619 stop:957 length:339 start_codon:yes stop_codon:yes gene_type:complete
MNPVTDIVFSLTWILLLIWAIRSISKGWSVDSNRPSGMWTTQVKKAVHPEMEGVKPGTELMGVSFEEKPTSCDLEEYQALQERIEELKLQLDPDDEDDEDDDDGDVPALLKR